MDFASEEPVVEAVHVEAVVETSGAAITFVVSGRAGIPNDGSPHKVALAGWDLPARFDLVAAPKLAAHAFRRARATNPGPALLLAGRAQVFHEDEFVGSTHLKAAAPGEELELYLGVEDRVRITRKLVEGAVDRRFLSDQRRLSYAYEIKVQNLRDRREQVVVQDQLPVSRHEQITVRRQDVRPAPAEETKLGRLRWDLTLEPQQEQTLRVAFSIEHPRAFTVVGLPPLASDAG